MKSRPAIPILRHIPRAFLIVFLLLAAGSPGIMASAATGDMFLLTISQMKPTICVGDTVNVTIRWSPNSQSTDSSGLAPLAGPSRITLQASLGSFYPSTPQVGGANSGVASVSYTADKEGKETLFATAWVGGSSDAIASESFEIKACKYTFSLKAEFTLEVSVEDLSYVSRYTVKSSGELVPEDPENNPQHLVARSKTVRMDAVIPSWSSSKCVLFTYEPGFGLGEVDATADPGPMGIGMVLKLGPPRDLAWELNLTFACNGDGHTVAGVYPIASADPWVTATFPSGSGQQTIKLDMFEVPYQRLQGSEGITVSYTATLTLEKKLP